MYALQNDFSCKNGICTLTQNAEDGTEKCELNEPVRSLLRSIENNPPTGNEETDEEKQLNELYNLHRDELESLAQDESHCMDEGEPDELEQVKYEVKTYSRRYTPKALSRL